MAACQNRGLSHIEANRSQEHWRPQTIHMPCWCNISCQAISACEIERGKQKQKKIYRRASSWNIAGVTRKCSTLAFSPASPENAKVLINMPRLITNLSELALQGVTQAAAWNAMDSTTRSHYVPMQKDTPNHHPAAQKMCNTSWQARSAWKHGGWKGYFPGGDFKKENS